MRHPKRVGMFGGAFDPPHLAHMALAKAAVQQLQLDVLHIVPTGLAWHKARTLSAPAHRLAMCNLAFAQVPSALVDPQETLKSGPSYTVDTLHILQARYPQAQLFLVLGEDQVRSLPQWHRVSDILRAAIICAAPRPNSAGPVAEKSAENTPPVALEIPGMRTLEVAPSTLSATDIRSRSARHASLASLVSGPVARYIDHHHLYQTEP